ncbi:MAG: hypothetical protein PHY93_21360 [Bacteriovorax sp.]|nr:hypothetical protein [Bacteriovorax sp.]
MKKLICVLSLFVYSFGAFANSHCILGGGTSINLPSNAYFQRIVEKGQNEIEVSILERKSNGHVGALLLNETFFFEKKDLKTLRSLYKSSDRKIILSINENPDNDILSTWMVGTGKGIDKDAQFAFEGRSCGSL